MSGQTWGPKHDSMKLVRRGCFTKTILVIVGLVVLVMYLVQREVVTGVILLKTNGIPVPEDGVLQQRLRTPGNLSSDRGQNIATPPHNEGMSYLFCFYLKSNGDAGDLDRMSPESRFRENVKVLLVTYMRGGSSFLGELINRNPSACYWYEPMEAMYHSMYGVVNVLLPLDIIYNINGSKRVYSAYEKANLVEYTHNILSKSFERLPLPMFYNRLIIDSKSRWTQGYRKCLIRRYPGKVNWMVKWRRRKCRECRITPTLDELNGCYRYTEKANGTVQIMTPKHQIYPKCPEANQVLCLRNCMASMFRRMKTCEAVVSKAKSQCVSKQIIGMKAIRMPMDLVGDLLKVDPSIKVIHYVRDPRGITASRKRSAWLRAKLSGTSWLKEITFLCKRIMDDVTTRKELEKRFPGQFLTLRYEDFATDPQARGKEVYDFINTLFPVDVQKWLYSSTHNSKGSKRFGTVRKNSTKTAYSWRTKVPTKTIGQWTEPCLQVLKELNYEI